MIYKKGIAVFMMVTLLLSSISILGVKEVDAAQPFCCVRSNDGQYCIEGESQNVFDGRCQGNLLTGSCDAPQVSDCRQGTCVPPSGVCISDYTYAQCQDIGGVWHNQPESQVAECKMGCCKETSVCGLVQKTQCSGDFDSAIDDARECDALCAADEVGCCWASGSCEFVKREDCPNSYNFELNSVCSQVSHCDAIYEDHVYTACGDDTLIPNANLDVYWYDSNGNMMEKVGEPDYNGVVHFIDVDGDREQDSGECNYPDYKCFDADEKGGMENAYCKSTACVLDCEECTPQSFRNGDSICLNLGKGKFTENDKSKYLKEYILTCDSGEVLEDRELDRSEEICVDGTKVVDGVERNYAKGISNNWAQCAGGEGNDDYCGEGGGIADYAGYIPLVGGPLLALGSWCSGSPGFKMPGAYFGGNDNCENMGKVGDKEMCYYDHDVWSPIGSCNPIYPPDTSDRCGECGKGGDSSTNMCTEEECNALGDCTFRHQHLNGGALVTAGALALGTAVGTMTVARGICAFAFAGSEACNLGILGGVKAALGSQLYWGILGMVYGLSASGSQGYHEDGAVEYDFMNEDGTYNLAKVLVIDKALKVEGSTGEGAEELVIGGTLMALEQVAVFGLCGAGGGSVGTGGGYSGWDIPPLSPPNSNQQFSLGSNLCAALGPLGIALTVYGMSESFNAGECSAETAYTDNTHCSQCGPAEGQFFCTEERCGILGEDNGNCKWISKDDGTIDGICIPIDPTNTDVPAITNIQVQILDEEGIFVSNHSASRQTLDITQEIDWTDANNYKIKINTDIRSDCVADFNSDIAFDDMTYNFNNSFETEHYLEFNLTPEIKTPGQATLYMKCKSANGMVNQPQDDQNWIKMRFGDRPDILPPEILSVDPFTGIFFSEGTEQLDLSLVVFDNNGVRDCKYSTDINDTSYLDMPNSFVSEGTTECPTNLMDNCQRFTASLDLTQGGEEYDLTGYGYEENATQFDYTFACIDNYEPANEVSRNYSIFVFPTFEMNVTAPEEDSEVYDSTPEINISTNVDTQCKYKIDSDINWTNINDGVDSRIYSYELEDALTGTVAGVSHVLTVRCRDIAYNYQEEQIRFYVLSDESGPKPVRIYTSGALGSGGTLYVRLDELAECKYSTEEENFDFDDDDENIALMRAVLPERIEDDKLVSELQTASWDSDVYYLLCRDEWENEARFTIYP